MNKTITDIFSAFGQIHALVIGDVMLDTYWWGESHRISPEAPVPIVEIHEIEHRPGGAANVAANMQALGAQSIVLALAGYDDAGQLLKQTLESRQIDACYICCSKERKTTQKNRVMSSKRQVLRFDIENTHPLSATEQEEIKKKFDAIIEHYPLDVIVLQDYNKGLLVPALINYILHQAATRKIPVAVDPKQAHFFEYKGVALFKPNLKEVHEALHTDIDRDNPTALLQACKQLHQQLACDKILLTLSEKGMFGYTQEDHFLIPGYERRVADVSGAGDTVIAVAALCISQQLDFELTARLANIAGGLVCETVGVTPIDKSQLMQQAISLLS